MIFTILMAALPLCPNWISDNSNAAVDHDVHLSDTQRVKNKIRCYYTLILPWQNRCTQRGERGCRSKVDRWVDRNFTVMQTVSPTCPNYTRETHMINVRSFP